MHMCIIFTMLPATAATWVCSSKLYREIIVAHNIALGHTFTYILLPFAATDKHICAYSSHVYCHFTPSCSGCVARYQPDASTNAPQTHDNTLATSEEKYRAIRKCEYYSHLRLQRLRVLRLQACKLPRTVFFAHNIGLRHTFAYIPPPFAANEQAYMCIIFTF